MKKILVYHLFVDDTFKDNISYNLHKECLQMYGDVFDEMTFVIRVNDMNRKDIIETATNWVLEVSGDKPLTIKIKENHPWFEVQTFKEEILENVDTLRDYVFFAHNKGALRMDGRDNYTKTDPESVLRWIFGLYYFSLNFMNEVEDRFSGHVRASEMFYGPFLTQYRDPSVSPMLRYNKNNCFYQGTFYWINMPKFSNYIKQGLITLPEVDDRYWVEMLPGVVCGRELFGDGLASHKDKAILDDFNLYKMNEEQWRWMTGEVLGEPDFVDIYNSLNFRK